MNENITKGTAFEDRCLDLLRRLGLTNLVAKRSADLGADVLGSLGDVKYVFQARTTRRSKGIGPFKKQLAPGRFTRPIGAV